MIRSTVSGSLEPGLAVWSFFLLSGACAVFRYGCPRPLKCMWWIRQLLIHRVDPTSCSILRFSLLDPQIAPNKRSQTLLAEISILEINNPSHFQSKPTKSAPEFQISSPEKQIENQSKSTRRRRNFQDTNTQIQKMQGAWTEGF